MQNREKGDKIEEQGRIEAKIDDLIQEQMESTVQDMKKAKGNHKII